MDVYATTISQAALTDYSQKRLRAKLGYTETSGRRKINIHLKGTFLKSIQAVARAAHGNNRTGVGTQSKVCAREGRDTEWEVKALRPRLDTSGSGLCDA
ncbi:hypothetical protein EVAR_81392_1 [Eumeta japonica]|uniref:Uncharacterized protein n=1 Tax=Eumeta variegata TaxID=151549 RepID=A0A4C1WFB2_EUMVA|nr:hypothetical protein EVAR_81392_1 [Eumeta japonica]